MAAVVFIVGSTFSIMVLKSGAGEAALAVQAFIPVLLVTAALLGVRQAANALKAFAPAPVLKTGKVDDNRFPKESPDVPAPDARK